MKTMMLDLKYLHRKSFWEKLPYLFSKEEDWGTGYIRNREVFPYDEAVYSLRDEITRAIRDLLD